jgi:DNA-directed RNA polymerase subunit RPC12/RpoP
MGMIEGGQFECYMHDFKTSNIEEWNSHCMESDEHTEQGTTACIRCGTKIEFSNLPFQPITESGSKNIALKCPDCSQKTEAGATITKVEEEESE